MRFSFDVHSRRRPLQIPVILFATALTVAIAAGAESAPPVTSPFLPPAGSAPAPEAGPAAYAFVGMTVVGDDTLLSISREREKRSVWIPVGKTVSEITAVRYDEKNDEAIIRVEGKELTLPMRKAVVVAAPVQVPRPATLPAGAPSSQAAAPATSAQIKMPPLNQQEEKEMEARMLVSDLLEIGQQQRKAYEAAQREAAAKSASGKVAPKKK